MALPISPSRISLALVLLFVAPGYGDETPEQTVAHAMACFDNQIVYHGCESAYRLNPSGNINVPMEATDRFCNGPCLIETQRLLNCLDGALVKFLFYNRATAQNVRDALRVGCSYSAQRGNFNPGWFLQGEISRSLHDIFPSWISYCILVSVGCFHLLTGLCL